MSNFVVIKSSERGFPEALIPAPKVMVYLGAIEEGDVVFCSDTDEVGGVLVIKCRASAKR